MERWQKQVSLPSSRDRSVPLWAAHRACRACCYSGSAVVLTWGWSWKLGLLSVWLNWVKPLTQTLATPRNMSVQSCILQLLSVAELSEVTPQITSSSVISLQAFSFSFSFLTFIHFWSESEAVKFFLKQIILAGMTVSVWSSFLWPSF